MVHDLGLVVLLGIVRLVIDQDFFYLHLHLAHVAADWHVEPVREVGPLPVHILAGDVAALNPAVALLLLGESGAGALVGDGAVESRQQLCCGVQVDAGIRLIASRAVGIVNLEVILVDVALFIHVGLEGGVRVLSVQRHDELVLPGGREDAALRIVSAGNLPVVVAVEINLDAGDRHMHRHGRGLERRVVEEEAHGVVRHIALVDGDRGVARVAVAVVEDDILRVLVEVDTCNI